MLEVSSRYILVSVILQHLFTIIQNCATGLTPENKTPKTLVEDMVRILDDRDIRYVADFHLISSNLIFICSSKDKARIISLYIQYREGVPDEDRRRLVQHARLSMFEQDAVKNLQHLGVRISRVSSLFADFVRQS